MELTHPMTLTDPTVLPRAIRLVEYLEAVRNLREQPIRDVAEYRDRRWWAGDIPAHPACVVTSAGEEPWLRVSKAQVPAPPAPYLVSDVADPESEPAFAAGFDEAFPGTSEQHNQELRDALADYIAGPWQEWAPRARPALKARALYEDLFELRQRLQRDSAMIELVWGYGILTWLSGDSRITHPLITTQVQLSFDAETGAISVVPEAMVPHHMEIDMLHGLRLSGFDLLVDARGRFRDNLVGPFDAETRAQYEKLLAPLGHDARLIDAAVPPPPTDAPQITATWVLMVRPRGTMYRP